MFCAAVCMCWLMLPSLTARLWMFLIPGETRAHPRPCLRLWGRNQLHVKGTSTVGHLLGEGSETGTLQRSPHLEEDTEA